MPRPVPTESRDPLFVSAKEAALMLGLSRNQMYLLLDRGAVESRYFGKRRLVDLGSLKAFAAALPTERAG